MVNTYFGLYFPLFFMSLAPLRQPMLGIGGLENSHKNHEIHCIFSTFPAAKRGNSPEIQHFCFFFQICSLGTKISSCQNPARLFVIPWFFSEKDLQTLDHSLDEADVSAKAPGLTRQSSIYKDMSP